MTAAVFSMSLGWAAAGVLAAGLVRGFAGFGGALVMAPLLSLVFPPVQAIALVLLIEWMGFLQMLPGSFRHIRWGRVAPMVLVAGLCVPLGALLVIRLDPHLMSRAISAVVVLLALLLIGGWRASREPRLPGALGVACVSGVLEGLAGTPGPPVVLYMYAGPDSAAANRHNLIGYFTCLDALALVVYRAAGAVDATMLLRAAVLIPVSILSTWLGERLFRHAGEALLRRVALLLILAIGLAGLLHW